MTHRTTTMTHSQYLDSAAPHQARGGAPLPPPPPPQTVSLVVVAAADLP